MEGFDVGLAFPLLNHKSIVVLLVRRLPHPSNPLQRGFELPQQRFFHESDGHLEVVLEVDDGSLVLEFEVVGFLQIGGKGELEQHVYEFVDGGDEAPLIPEEELMLDDGLHDEEPRNP